MRLLAISTALTLLQACTSTSGPILVTIEVERSSDDPQPIEITVEGGDFTETVELDGSRDRAIVSVPEPGTHSFYTGGVIEESTGPTSGCRWDSPPLQVDITGPTTVRVEVGVVCA